jgi:hypothetical protein
LDAVPHTAEAGAYVLDAGSHTAEAGAYAWNRRALGSSRRCRSWLFAAGVDGLAVAGGETVSGVDAQMCTCGGLSMICQ